MLGRGGFGITYLVRDEGLEKDFALKEFFPEDLVRREGTSIRFAAKPNSESDYRWGLKKFYDEARLLAQFNHANIVNVRRVFEANNSAYMLLDFVNGSTLENWLQGLDSPPTQEELDLISAPLLSALELVHANRTWHLDISPENVMIRASDGAPILLDFGASRFEIKQHSQLVSALVFKSGYSAPEQYTSNADRYGPWTDIYAFGCHPLSRHLRQPADGGHLAPAQGRAEAGRSGRQGALSRQFPQGHRLGHEAAAGRAAAVDRRMAQDAARIRARQRSSAARMTRVMTGVTTLVPSRDEPRAEPQQQRAPRPGASALPSPPSWRCSLRARLPPSASCRTPGLNPLTDLVKPGGNVANVGGAGGVRQRVRAGA